MKDSYPELFPSGNLRGRKLFLGRESCNSPIFCYFIFQLFYVCLYMLVCDYLSLSVNPWV